MMLKGKRNKIWAADTKELANVTVVAENLAQILKKFGLATTSSNYVALKTRLKYEKIDFDHISLGRSSNSGRKFPNKKVVPLEQILVKNSSYSRTHLKKRLLRVGLLKNECACGQGPEWNGKPLTMQIDHINGIANDNRLENLRMICPNCHSQTETFSGRNVIRISSNGKTDRSERSNVGSIPTIRTMLIKKFSSADLDDMIRVGYEAYSDYGEELLDSPDKTLTFIAWPIAHGYYVNGECVGSVYGYSEEDVFHIYSVEVLHKFHKQGIGQILLNFCLNHARQLGFKKFRAYALSDGGKKLTAKYGFVKVGERSVAGNYTADVVVLNE